MKQCALILIGLLVMVGCTTDSYETGDGNYSYLCADFVEAHSSAVGEMDYVITDADDSLSLTPRAKVKWAATADSVYRALLYYNKKETQFQPVSVSQVPVVSWRNTSDLKEIHTDPVTFESAWLSANRKYLNIGFLVKTGQQDGTDNVQTVGLMCDSVAIHADGTRDMYLRLSHNQNGVPEYYSNRTYISVPLQNIFKGYTIHLSVNTYSCIVNKSLVY